MKVVLVLVLCTVAVLAASCGGSGAKIYSLEKTKTCLSDAGGATVGGSLDFVATTSTGGAFKAKLDDNSVTVVFGATEADANNIDDAYRRFRAKNVGIDDVLRQQGNAVMLWHLHPSDPDLATVIGCLK